MTYQRPAYEEVTIAHDGNTVTLRPTLRAVIILEQRYGAEALNKALFDANYTILSDIIKTACSRREEAESFFNSFDDAPLMTFFDVVTGPIAELFTLFSPSYVPAPSPRENNSKGKSDPAPMSEVYADLYSKATGWLGWTPGETWSATPTEIAHAFAGQADKLKAIYGGADDKSHDPHDTAFDREGLQALKAKIARQG